VEEQTAPEGRLVPPWPHEPDLTSLAAFTLDPIGRVVSWPVTATSLLGHQAAAIIGRDVCEVLLTGPGQRSMVDHALAQVAAGAVCTTTAVGGPDGGGRFALRWEPTEGADGTVLVIVHRAQARPAPGWLSYATARIGSSLDLSQTASEVADAAVASFADAAVIYAAERLLAADDRGSHPQEHGTAVRRLAACLAGQEEALTGSLLPPGEVLFLAGDTPRAQAMASGEPHVCDHLDGETTARIARHPLGPQIAARYTSFLVMPLIARGVTVGCAVFGRTPASQAFNPSDVTHAGELASRAAVCIDNARLYDRERRTALALQRGLLPSQPSIPAGIEVAHRYLPVGGQVVGGDWHDIVSLPGGRAALLVGDAMGHGPEAAAVMVQLRTAAHTLAELDLPPRQVLGRLDTLAARMDVMSDGMTAPPFATCVYAVVDPAGGAGEITQAGHLPPVLVYSDGSAQTLDLPPGLPLGLGAESFEAVRFTLPPGATLALYTDGLVESRTRPVDDGLAALGRALGSALARPASTLDSACEAVTQALRDQGEDDITLLLARIR
jgi:serine phosphatase RsbU (regulator of sigma subunit)